MDVVDRVALVEGLTLLVVGHDHLAIFKLAERALELARSEHVLILLPHRYLNIVRQVSLRGHRSKCLLLLLRHGLSDLLLEGHLEQIDRLLVPIQPLDDYFAAYPRFIIRHTNANGRDTSAFLGHRFLATFRSLCHRGWDTFLEHLQNRKRLLIYCRGNRSLHFDDLERAHATHLLEHLHDFRRAHRQRHVHAECRKLVYGSPCELNV